MKSYRIILIVMSMMFTSSCKDAFDVSNSSFVKIYGENLESIPTGFFQKEDGGFVIYGEINKNVSGDGYTETGEVPTIIVTDEFGNQVLSRQYPIATVEFKNNQASNFPFPVEGARFISIVQVANGNYFATLRVRIPPPYFGDVPFGSNHYMILDKNFNIIYFGNFNDYANPVTYIHYIPMAYNIPGSSDIVVLMTTSRKLAGITPDFDSDHYALYRFSMDGEFIKVSSIDRKYKIRAIDLSFDNEGNIVVSGYDYSEICHRSFIDVIDINDLNLIENYPISAEGQWHWFRSIEKIANGYAIQDFSYENCEVFDPESPIGFTNADEAMGEIWFLNNQFEVINKQEVISGISFVRSQNMIQTADGGYVLGFTDNIDSESRRGAIVTKTDQFGMPLWSYREPGSLIQTGMLETTPDGGIVFIAMKDFNTVSWYLIKLNKDGKLD